MSVLSAPSTTARPVSRAASRTGTVLTVLLGLFLLVDAVPKLLQMPMVVEATQQMGFAELLGDVRAATSRETGATAGTHRCFVTRAGGWGSGRTPRPRHRRRPRRVLRSPAARPRVDAAATGRCRRR